MNYNFEYETQGTTNFLVYKKKESDVLDSVTVGMISNNKIEGILPFVYQQIDNDSYFKYNISSLNTLTEYFQGMVSKKRFIKVMSSLVNAFTQADEYMIEFSAVVLEQDYIFVNPKTAEVEMIVLPYKREQTGTMVDFLRMLLFSVRYDETEDRSYIATIMSFLNSNQFFDAKEFMNLLNDMLKEDVAPAVKQPETRGNQTGVSGGFQIATKIEKEQGTTVLNQAPAEFLDVQKIEPENKVQTVISSSNVNVLPEVNTDLKKQDNGKKGLFSFKKKEEKPKKEERPKKEEKPKKSLFGKKGSESQETSKASVEIPGRTGGMNIPGQNIGMRIPGQSTEMAASSNGFQNTNTVQQYQSNGAVQEQDVHLKKTAVVQQDFGNTVDLRTYHQNTDGFASSEPGTQVLDLRPYLYVSRTRECFELYKERAKIGSDAGKNDFCISGNGAISRAHAIIHYENGNVYIEDNYSTNGTKIDGEKIKPGVLSRALQHGTKIYLGDEELELRLY